MADEGLSPQPLSADLLNSSNRLNQLGPAETQPAPKPSSRFLDPFSAGLIRSFFEANFLYVFSAMLMMYGAFLLIPVTGEVRLFGPVFKGLLSLQAYEFLVIAAAGIIVWRLGILSDAVTLLVVELALLFDPTFFSNNFATLELQGALTNVVCLLLVLLKLIVLQQFLRFRLAPQAWAALTLAAAYVYLADGPLALKHPFLGMAGYYQLIGWGPALIALAYPSVENLFRIESARPDFISPRQETWLRRFLVFLPMATAMAHYVESYQVYFDVFYLMYLAPMPLALALLASTNKRAFSDRGGAISVDAMVVLSLFWSLPHFNQASAITLHARGVAPNLAMLNMGIPLMIAGAASAGVYWHYWLRRRYWPALARIALLAVLGGIYAISKTAIIEALWRFICAVCAHIGQWLAAHPVIVCAAVCVALGVVAWRYRNAWTWFAFGLALIWFVSSFPEGGREEWIAEMIQSVLALGILVSHWFHPRESRAARYFLAFVIVAIGFCRLASAPVPWKHAVVWTELVVLVVAGVALRQYGYLTIGALQLAAMAIHAGIIEKMLEYPALSTIAAALIVFALGVVVTFRKRAILDWIVGQTATGAGAVAPLSSSDGEPGEAETNNKEDDG